MSSEGGRKTARDQCHTGVDVGGVGLYLSGNVAVAFAQTQPNVASKLLSPSNLESRWSSGSAQSRRWL